MPKGIPNKPKPKPEPPGRVNQAYENGPGKPIIHNGCGWCGMLPPAHTPSCPMGRPR